MHKPHSNGATFPWIVHYARWAPGTSFWATFTEENEKSNAKTVVKMDHLELHIITYKFKKKPPKLNNTIAIIEQNSLCSYQIWRKKRDNSQKNIFKKKRIS